MSEVPLYLCGTGCSPSSASLGFTVSSKADMLGVRYNSVNFGEKKSPGSPHRSAQTDWASASSPLRIRVGDLLPASI